MDDAPGQITCKLDPSFEDSPLKDKHEAVLFKPVSTVVRFQPIRLGSPSGGEDAWLGWANHHLVALLVRIQGTGIPRRRHGWFLEAGYGPCRREGLLFPTLN